MVLLLVTWVMLSIVVGLAVGAAIGRGNRMALRLGTGPAATGRAASAPAAVVGTVVVTTTAVPGPSAGPTNVRIAA